MLKALSGKNSCLVERRGSSVKICTKTYLTVRSSALYRFRAFSGSAAKKNDPKTMQQRREKLREQLEASGDKPEE